jgi:hypothetical protein
VTGAYGICERGAQHHSRAFISPEELHPTPLRQTGAIAVVKTFVPRAVAIKSRGTARRNEGRGCEGRAMRDLGLGGSNPSRRAGRGWRTAIGEEGSHEAGRQRRGREGRSRLYAS